MTVVSYLRNDGQAQPCTVDHNRSEDGLKNQSAKRVCPKHKRVPFHWQAGCNLVPRRGKGLRFFFLLLSFFVPDFRSVLHCYCYKQHVQALEDDVAAVTHPNVTNKSHEKQSGGSEPREAPQGQLPPPLPPDLCEADTVSGGRTCRKTAAQVANRGVEIFEGGVAHWEGKKLPPLLHYRCWSSEKAARAPTAPDVTGLENHLKPSKNAEANA